MSAKVEVKPEVLLYAVEYAQLLPLDVIQKFPKFEMWLSGEGTPTFNQLKEFANFTKYPFSFLFLDNPIVFSPVQAKFRSLKGRMISPELRDMISWMQSIQEWMSDYRQNHSGTALDFIGALTAESSPKDLVELARRVLKKSWPPSKRSENAVYYLRDSLEDVGVIVMRASFVRSNQFRKVSTREARGFSLYDKYAPLIFVNQSDALNAQVFTLVHEFMHLLIGENNILSSDESMIPEFGKVETLCNKATAEFLVPLSMLDTTINEYSYNDVKKLASKFQVSELMMVNRLNNLGFVKDELVNEVKQITNERLRAIAANRKKGGGAPHSFVQIRARMSPEFVRNLIWRARDGTISYSDAYNLFGYGGDTFKSFERKLFEG